MEVAREVPPYLRVFKDGTIQRLVGTETLAASFDPTTQVSSKDIIIPETAVSARLYRPNLPSNHHKLPLLIYFHGGAFCISSAADPPYHNNLNAIVAESSVIAVSVDYRNAPEHPLPAAYDDAFAAVESLLSSTTVTCDPWIHDHVDFTKVYVAGDSAGANISHHIAIRFGSNNPTRSKSIHAIILIHPYFLGTDPISCEVLDPGRKSMVDNWWSYVCPSEKGNDDPWINPFADGAPSLENLGCERVLVCVAEKDILKDRGKLYYDKLVKSAWKGTAEIEETEGEDHVFHIFDAHGDKARAFIKRLGSFINQV